MPCQSPSESGLKQSEKEYVSNGKRSKVGEGGIYGRNVSLEGRAEGTEEKTQSLGQLFLYPDEKDV